jgi:hypothetical protein
MFVLRHVSTREKDKVWDADLVLRPFRDIPAFGRLAGYGGPPNRKAAQVVTKYIITDMYAKAIQGMRTRTTTMRWKCSGPHPGRLPSLSRSTDDPAD